MDPRKIARMMLAAGLLAGTGLAQADIYAFTDANGVRHISNVPDDPRYRLVMRTPKFASSPVRVAPAASGGLPFSVNETNRQRYAGEIARIADQYRLRPALLHAVISAESAYNPIALSHAGAMGMMQLMPATAERYGVADPYDPVANIEGGARYLRDLLDQFSRLDLALAAYNAGEGAVARHGNAIPPYAETQTYVQRVLSFYSRYQQIN